jgi:hypothetical protein
MHQFTIVQGVIMDTLPQHKEGVRAFFAGLPTGSDPEQAGKTYPVVRIAFVPNGTRQTYLLLGRDATGIVARPADGQNTAAEFYPWSSIFSLSK